MSDKTPPAFQFYPKQWLGDDKVMLMDWDAQAMHLRLMCIAWQREQPCAIPNDETVIRKWLAQPSDEVWLRVWPQIKEAWQLGRGGMLVQRGLLAVYLKLKAHKEERSSSGKRGAERRWLSHNLANGSAIKEPLAKNGSSSSSSSSSAVKDLSPIVPLPKKAKPKAETAIQNWSDLIAHIDAAWQDKKRAGYPWDGQEIKKLHGIAKTYQVPGVMAMWDLYMGMGTYWGKLTGYMIDGLRKDIGVIVDDPRWKQISKKYEDKLHGINGEVVSTKELTASLGLAAKTI